MESISLMYIYAKGLDFNGVSYWGPYAQESGVHGFPILRKDGQEFQFKQDFEMMVQDTDMEYVIMPELLRIGSG